MYVVTNLPKSSSLITNLAKLNIDNKDPSLKTAIYIHIYLTLSGCKQLVMDENEQMKHLELFRVPSMCGVSLASVQALLSP